MDAVDDGDWLFCEERGCWEKIPLERDAVMCPAHDPLAHAEAVAARLVEVICEDDVDRQDSFSVQVWRAEVIRDQIADRLAEQERLCAAALDREFSAYTEGARDAYDIAEQIARGDLP